MFIIKQICTLSQIAFIFSAFTFTVNRKGLLNFAFLTS